MADTGVPGLDSDDEFCRSWSEFAGTFQALALAASLARDPADAARTEVAGSSTIVAAAAGLDEHLPDELESERQALTVGLVGPMARRAGAAVDALTAAGLTDAEISALGEAWLGTLTASGLDEPIEQVPLDPAVADRVDAAAASLAAARPSIVEDPALITDASTSAGLNDFRTGARPDAGAHPRARLRMEQAPRVAAEGVPDMHEFAGVAIDHGHVPLIETRIAKAGRGR